MIRQYSALTTFELYSDGNVRCLGQNAEELHVRKVTPTYTGHLVLLWLSFTNQVFGYIEEKSLISMTLRHEQLILFRWVSVVLS